ncbi:DUF192 domain-containing protein [Verrucomicrobiota bacterium]
MAKQGIKQSMQPFHFISPGNPDASPDFGRLNDLMYGSPLENMASLVWHGREPSFHEGGGKFNLSDKELKSVMSNHYRHQARLLNTVNAGIKKDINAGIKKDKWRTGLTAGGIALSVGLAPYIIHKIRERKRKKSIPKTAAYAPGIPDKSNFGDPTGKLKINDIVEYVLQHHKTHRVPKKPHYDLRLGKPDTGLFSWAVPDARLPEAKEKKLVIQQPIHESSYGDFTGTLGKGFGHGVVQMADRGKALITNATPNTVSFTLAHGKVPVRYTLINMKTEKGTDWLLIHKPLAEQVEGVGDKPKITSVDAKNLDGALAQADRVQAKIDGASTVYEFGPKKIEAYSVNPSVEGKPIVHTERLGLHDVPTPKGLEKTILRGEAFGTREGKAIPFQELSGILNSTIGKSIGTQKAKNIKLKNALFDVIKYKGENAPISYNEKMKLLEEMTSQLPKEKFMIPETVQGADQAKQMIERIGSGKDPLTREGVVIRMPTGKALKFKFRPDATVYLAGVYPGEGKRKQTAGGLLFSEKPKGKATGRIGTGYSDEQLKDIVSNLNNYTGKPMRINYQEKFPSGKYRAPSFAGFETDKPVLKTAQTLEQIKAYLKPREGKGKRGKPGLAYNLFGKPHIGYGHLINPNTSNNLVQAGVTPSTIPSILSTNTPLNNTQMDKLLEQDITKKLPRYNNYLSQFKLPAVSANVPFFGEIYRGGFSPTKSPKTFNLLSKGDWLGASKEYLNSNEYKQHKGKGIGKRMQAASDAIKNMGTQFKKPGAEAKESSMTKTVETNLVPLEIIKSDGSKKIIKADIANTEKKRNKGLSKRSSLPADYGMFFDKAGAFWMKDVEFPLDIAFINKSGIIVDIKQMTKISNDTMFKPLYMSDDPSASYALEVNANWFKQNNIETGDQICVSSY